MRSMDYSELYKIKKTPGIERIYRYIDAKRAVLLPPLQNYIHQVKSYIENNKQTQAEINGRLKVWRILRTVTEPGISEGFLALGGSTISKLATQGADLDLCFAVRCTNGKCEEEDVNMQVLGRIYQALNKLWDEPIKGVQVNRVKLVQARVPLLKVELRFPYDQIEVDINCNCVAGIYNSHLLFYYAKLDDRFVQMNMILKQWGKVNYVIDPRYGKLNSYTVSLMIIHFLQCGVQPPILPNLYGLFPEYFDGTADVSNLNYSLDLKLPDIPKNDRTVGELIYGFFEYYSRFNYDIWGISIKEGRIFDRRTRPEEDKKFLFFLEEAYDGMTVPKNLTKRHKLKQIVVAFQDHRKDILRDICNPHPIPVIDTAWDYQCPEEDEMDRYANQWD